ncbi:hypothetical protein [Dyella humicola]|uniref:hypothetical protein n=1 Tax=Dyella humicola TaxID=2992126 RepID=UPI00224D6E38|nr:hypothetical protein [Dyella humicola]
MTYPEIRHPSNRTPPTWDGTLPDASPPPMPPRAPAPRSGYIAAHWRGELSLAESYWLNGVLLGVAMVILESALLAWMKNSHPSLTSVLVIAAIYGAARLIMSVWQVVGILRSAALSGSRWAVVVNILMVLAILAALGRLPTQWHNLQGLAQGAAEQRRLSHYKIGLDPSGDAILAQGTIGVDYAKGIAEAFTAHRDIHRLVLDSLGGDVDNGMQLHDFLVAHPDISVEVDHFCASACTLAFIGGTERLVSVNATLGFHQMHSMIDTRFSADYTESKQEAFKSLLAKRGASEDFIGLAFAKQGNDIYAPNADSLFANHIITGLRLDDRVVSAGQWRTEQFLYAYYRNANTKRMGDALTLIRTQMPQIYDAWVQRNLHIQQEPGRQQRLTDYNTALWHTLHAARNAAMHTVTSDHVRGFTMGWRDMLLHMSKRLSANACGRYLSGLPVDAGKENDAIYRANSESYVDLLTDNDRARSMTIDWSLGARELAQVRRNVGQSVSMQPGGDIYALTCQRQIALLDGLLGLPGAGSDMALRTLFTQGQ